MSNPVFLRPGMPVRLRLRLDFEPLDSQGNPLCDALVLSECEVHCLTPHLEDNGAGDMSILTRMTLLWFKGAVRQWSIGEIGNGGLTMVAESLIDTDPGGLSEAAQAMADLDQAIESLATPSDAFGFVLKTPDQMGNGAIGPMASGGS